MLESIPFILLLSIVILVLFQRSGKLIKEMNIIAIYCLFCAVIEALLLILHDKETSIILGTSFKIGEFLLFTTLAYLLFYNHTYHKILKIGSLLYCCFFITSLLYYELQMIYSVTAAITAIFLLSYSILIMYDWISLTPLKPIYERPSFWLVLGFLIYEAGNYFNFILQEMNLHQTFNLHGIFAIIRNGFFLTAIYLIQYKNNKVLTRLNQIKF